MYCAGDTFKMIGCERVSAVTSVVLAKRNNLGTLAFVAVDYGNQVSLLKCAIYLLLSPLPLSFFDEKPLLPMDNTDHPMANI